MPSVSSSLLKRIGFVELPKRHAFGGFDHAVVTADVFDPSF